MNDEIIKVGNIYGFTGGSFAGNVYDSEGICPCLNTFGGAFDISYPSSDTRRGRVQGDSSICPAICAAQNALMVFEGVFDEQKGE